VGKMHRRPLGAISYKPRKRSLTSPALHGLSMKLLIAHFSSRLDERFMSASAPPVHKFFTNFKLGSSDYLETQVVSLSDLFIAKHRSL
jgi:hypothetical protein